MSVKYLKGGSRTVTSELALNVRPYETRLAVIEDNLLVEFYIFTVGR